MSPDETAMSVEAASAAGGANVSECPVCHRDPESGLAAAIPDPDSGALPEGVEAAMDEAVDCHECGCSDAAAEMLRRTVEEVCDDLGVVPHDEDLADRIEELESKIPESPAVVEGLREIPLFSDRGESSGPGRYRRVDKRSVEAGIGVVKRLVGVVYRRPNALTKLGAYLAGNESRLRRRGRSGPVGRRRD